MKKIFVIILIMVLSLGLLVSAHGEETFAEAGEIIKQKTPCSNLTDNQLEVVGDYYMEQMHPGEAHGMMDQMMGGEGSDSLKQMHIQMAKRLYCNKDVGGMMGGGMMNMMMGSGGMNMMGTNMMGGSFGSGSWWLWGIVGIIFWIALLAALILLIIWLYKKITGKAAEDGSALEILKKRYAQGEISNKEFTKIKKEIK